MRHRLSLAVFVTCALAWSAAASGQNRAPAAPSAKPKMPAHLEEAVELTNGWALVSQGLLAEASARIPRILGAYPRSAAAWSFAIEVDIARGGAAAGLGRYEQRLAQRHVEEPLLLRRVAVAVLAGAVNQKQEPAARVEALTALAADGDAQAAAALGREGTGKTGATSSRALASRGDARAVDALIAQAKRQPADVRTIDALGDSGSERAAPLLTGWLKESRNEIRGAAAEALAKLGDPAAVPNIKPLLDDPSSFVRVRAAGALYRLGDTSGLPLLQQLAASESPAMRLAAAEAMASRPDGAWSALVRELASVPDPEIQARAARLIAPHDAAFAKSVLDPLATHENPAIRQLAASAEGESVNTDDLTALRALLKSGSLVTRVRAAGRVLEVTR